MQCEIVYIVDTTQHKDSSCRKSNLFPVLNISYRMKGSKMWVCLGDVEIDLYTYNRFKNVYYRDFRRSDTDVKALKSKSDYERLTLFLSILETEFDNQMDRLVESIVREEIAMDGADTEERKDVNRLTRSLVTDGFRAIEVQI